MPGLLAGLGLLDLDLEALALRPALVHPGQHLGPVLGIGAPGARVDLDHGVALVVLPLEEGPQLELGEGGRQRGDRLLDLGLEGLVLLLAGHLGQRGDIVDLGGQPVEELEVVDHARQLTGDARGPCRGRPRGRDGRPRSPAQGAGPVARRPAGSCSAAASRRRRPSTSSEKSFIAVASALPAVAELVLLARAAGAGLVAARLVPLALDGGLVDRLVDRLGRPVAVGPDRTRPWPWPTGLAPGSSGAEYCHVLQRRLLALLRGLDRDLDVHQVADEVLGDRPASSRRRTRSPPAATR